MFIPGQLVNTAVDLVKTGFFKWSHVMPYTDSRMKLFNSDGKKVLSFIGKMETNNFLITTNTGMIVRYSNVVLQHLEGK